MKLLQILCLLIVLIGLSDAQNYPKASDNNLYAPIIEAKKVLTKTPPLHPEYDVLAYDIITSILPDSEKIVARVSISILISISMEKELLFDFAGLQVDSVFLDSKEIQRNVQGDLLKLELETPLMSGDTHLVCVHYQGTPQKGMYFRSNSKGDPVIYTHNEPYDAHYWFPCKDDPSDKAKLFMTVDVPDRFVVLSNGMLIEQTESRPQHTIFIWQEDYPIAPYLISIALSPYAVTRNIFTGDNSNLLLEYYVYPEDINRGATALEWVIEMLEYYNLIIGDFPFSSDKYAMSEVPFREASAMENQTATTMGDFVMDNEEVIAHELSHQWWGDALTPQSFVDIWLNEGFATYFDALFTEHKYGEEVFLQRMNTFHSLMNSDGSLAYPIYNPPPEYLFGSAVYFKGAWVLHMLRCIVGDDIFKEIIQQYYETYTYQNVATASFIDIVESVSGKSFSTFFDQWLNYGGIPFLIGVWEQDKNILNVVIKQNQSEPVYQFDLEVLIEGISADTLVTIPVNERETAENVYFPEKVSKIILDPNKKILSTSNSPVYFLPEESGLVSLYPNPFNESITITYQVRKSEDIEIIVYDVSGQRIDVLVDEKKTIGIYQVEWNGRNYASSSYYCVMKTKESSDIRKMTLIK